MTPAATLDADISIAEPGPIPEQIWITRIDERTDGTEPTWIGLDPTTDRLAPARGALVGITLSVALWVVLLFVLVSHFTRTN